MLIAATDHGETLCGATLARTAAIVAAMDALQRFKNGWVDGDPMFAEMVFRNHALPPSVPSLPFFMNHP